MQQPTDAAEARHMQQMAALCQAVQTLVAAILASDQGHGDITVTVKQEGGQPVIRVRGGPASQVVIRP